MRTDEDLAAVPMFAPLSADHRDGIAATYPVVRVPDGTVLARHGESARSLFVVHAGAVAGVVHHRDGSRTRYATLTGPCVLDKAAVLGGMHTATWITASSCLLRTLPATAFHQLLRDVPGLREHVLGLLSRQVQDARRVIADRDGTSSVTRVARWLAAQDGSRIVLPGGQQGLADELGLSRVTVNRALRRLAATGAVDTGPRGITVLDVDRLTRAAD